MDLLVDGQRVSASDRGHVDVERNVDDSPDRCAASRSAGSGSVLWVDVVCIHGSSRGHGAWLSSE